MVGVEAEAQCKQRLRGIGRGHVVGGESTFRQRFLDGGVSGGDLEGQAVGAWAAWAEEPSGGTNRA